MDSGQREPHALESAAGLLGIRVAVEKRVRDEEDRRRLRQEVSDFPLGMVEIAAPVERRIADQKEASAGRTGRGHANTTLPIDRFI